MAGFRERVAKRLRGSGYLDVDALSSDEDWVEVADLAIEATGAGRLESIVRSVAERGAPPSYDEETCWYCDAFAASPHDRHDVSCEWRRAVEWAGTDGGDNDGP